MFSNTASSLGLKSTEWILDLNPRQETRADLMIQPVTLAFPAYCIQWCRISDPESGSSCIGFAVGGGGGASKSGVPNRISVYRVTPAAELKLPPATQLVHETDTSPDVPSCLAVDSNGELLAACLGSRIAVYAVKAKGLVKLLEFRGDEAAREAEVVSIVFQYRPPAAADADVQQHTFHLASGGADGVVRVWSLQIYAQVLRTSVRRTREHPERVALTFDGACAADTVR